MLLRRSTTTTNTSVLVQIHVCHLFGFAKQTYSLKKISRFSAKEDGDR